MSGSLISASVANVVRTLTNSKGQSTVTAQKTSFPSPATGCARWEGKATAALPLSACSPGLASGQREDHGNLRLHFYWLAVKVVRLVPPLLHRLDGGRRQHGVAADQSQILDCAVLAGFRLDHESALHAGLSRQRWRCRR